MKTYLLVVLLFVVTHAAVGQWTREWTLGYSFSSPSGKMKQNIKQGNGVIMDYHLLSPSKKLSLGVDFNYSIYGYDQSRQQYTFPDGTTAEMDINVTNSFLNLMVAGRYFLLTHKKILPYLEGKAGYSWFTTNLNIYDPDDFDSCKPIEEDILQKDGTLIYSIGGGLRYDLTSLFKKLRKERLFINLSGSYTQGGLVNYMNTDAPSTHMGSSPPNRTGDVEASFINTQTQVIHKHHVGYVYTSFAQMMDYRVTFTLRY
ncbi:MAG: outer membrane beta-barrel protein [Cyclobacteriaceae bacterium]|nr:outer membrane beta-barrel protein [Cyclobacteriaceae bacterium]